MEVRVCNVFEYFLKGSKSKEEVMCLISNVHGLLQFILFAYFVICRKRTTVVMLLYV